MDVVLNQWKGPGWYGADEECGRLVVYPLEFAEPGNLERACEISQSKELGRPVWLDNADEAKLLAKHQAPIRRLQCPMASPRKVYCCRDKCEWWDPEQCRCSQAVASQALKEIARLLSAITNSNGGQALYIAECK